MDKLTVGQIVKGLKPGQFWAILVILFGLVAGAFTLGYKLQLSKGQIIEERTTAKLAEFRGLQTKERFLALYLRYLLAKSNLQTESSEENQNKVNMRKDSLIKYVMKLVGRGEETRDEIDQRSGSISKGGGEDSTLILAFDGSKWLLLPELGLAVEE